MKQRKENKKVPRMVDITQISAMMAAAGVSVGLGLGIKLYPQTRTSEIVCYLFKRK